MVLKNAKLGFELLVYIRDFCCNPLNYGLTRVEAVELLPKPLLTPREIEALGRAAKRVGQEMVTLIYDLSQSKQQDLVLCSKSEKAGSLRRVTYEDAENLYYYFLDELRAK